ncbi:AAA family ATPase [Pseudomonas asuensis]
MLLQPLLLVMDEPFNGLDDAASKELIELFDEYSRRSTILLTCHQPAIVECIKGIRWTLEEAPHAALTASQS